ncbi:RNA polymerase sigma factor [Sphingobacterium sp. HMA12]|uniref:RNA polymerase sigma factor n=1 Tax=Sphingobacterium sp. HMA12 TaxID=2050894 RepID=UPI000CE9BFA6|nr:RNA polymerase sigma-70 factor [Sphingobacterium sp. HMA12]
MLDIDIDLKLLSRLQQSDQKAFDRIYIKYSSILYRTCIQRLADSEICNDIIHDIFLSLWENRDKSDIKNLKAYLFQALRFKIIDYIEKKSKTESVLQGYLYQLQKDYIGTDDTIRTKLLQDLIQEEVDKFPNKMRLVYLMSRHENLSYAEIAQKLGISELTVRAHIKHALKRLRIKLSFFIFFLTLYLLH